MERHWWATQNNNLQPIKHDVPDRLMDHAEARKQSLEEWKLFQNTVVDPVMEGLGEELGLRVEEVEAVIGKLNINSASFKFRGERVEGRALYPTLSLVSHSCVANSRYQGENQSGFDLEIDAKYNKPILFSESRFWLLCCSPGQD